MSLSRVSVTIPQELVEQADREAKRLARSRSWLVTEAVRRYLGEQASAGAVREPTPSPYASGLGAHRFAQLEADLRLTPEQRVQEAERTARAAGGRGQHGRSTRLISFERYEDYLDWKRREDAR